MKISIKNIVPYTFAILLSSLLITGCTKTTIEDKSVENIAVVQSFLSPDNIPTVIVSKVVAFTTETSVAVDTVITGLQINIIHDDEIYPLQESTDSPGTYFDTTNNLNISEEQSYELYFIYNEQTITGTTEVPNKPQEFEISDTTIYLPKITEDTGPGSMPENENIELTWDNDNNDYYLVSIQYMEDEYDTINTIIEIDDAAEMANFSSEPLQNNLYLIRSMQFSFFGTYEVILSHIPEEYAGLYESLSQSSLDGLTEPETNVTNGEGIFTSYNSDTLRIHVYEQ